MDVKSPSGKGGSEAVHRDVESADLGGASQDEHDRKEYKGYGFKEDLSLEVKFKLPFVGQLRFNPLVSICSIVLIWGFVIWCIMEKENVPFGEWKRQIVDKFTWLYIGSQDLWFVFAVYLYFSKYGNLKLGKPDEKPEYNDVSWFMMLFACGIGVGLFFYGVAEPIYHYTGGNRYIADPTTPDNTLAQIAMNLTLYHWGVHAWIVYALIGLLLGIMSYREGLPMTMKSCMYPLIGDKIFGWMGDLIDIVSIMTTLFGVCTSLGLGTRQLNAGLQIINPDIPANDVTIQIIIIWCITIVATISTVSGVGMGIRRLSELCFGVGMFIMTICFFMDQTFYILNLLVQSIGYYFQYIIQLGFHTDAFEQLGPSYGDVDRNRFVPEGYERPDGPEDWMDGWTMFYWGWWISWSPFVGMFIAKISRGRTIRQFINGTLTAPVVYTLLWMVIFGGAGIRLERGAAEVGLCCHNGADKATGNWFVNSSALRQNAPLEETIQLSSDTAWMCDGGECSKCATSVIGTYSKSNATFAQFIDDYEQLARDFGSTSTDRTKVRLSCHQTEQMWFDVMRSYPGVGSFLAIFSMLAIALYFVTSSDSGSLVIDCLSANGYPDPPWIQRVFWALIEGATATALLTAGGKQSLSALQAAGIVSGLPYTFFICFLCSATWRAVQVAYGDFDPNRPKFEVGIFDPFFAEPFKRLKFKPALKLFVKFLVNIVMAPITVAKVAAKVYGENPEEREKWWKYAILSVGLFAFFILFHLLELVVEGMWAIAWFFYLGYTCFQAAVRMEMRLIMNIHGSIFEDFFASMFFYPNVAVQLDETVDVMISKDKVIDKDMKVGNSSALPSGQYNNKGFDRDSST